MRGGSVRRSPPLQSKGIPMMSRKVQEIDTGITMVPEGRIQRETGSRNKLTEQKERKKQTGGDGGAACLHNPPIGGISRESSASSIFEEVNARKQGESRKKREPVKQEMMQEEVLSDIRNERASLEEFLFNDSNKISKQAIKFILTKWSALELKLYEERIEKEKLKTTHHNTAPLGRRSYAHVVSVDTALSGPGRKPETNKCKIKDDHEVILIKPMEDLDKRNNEEIKNVVKNELKDVRNKIKVRGIRQMRSKGIVVEVNSKADVETIKQLKLKNVELKVTEPKKFDPYIIVYDIEKEYKPEDLKEDLIAKNFQHETEQNLKVLKDKVHFRFCFRAQNNNSRVNWVIQMPFESVHRLSGNGGVFMFWRLYKFKEYINILRCFKCLGYGHMAKYCNAPKQVCEFCGSMEHVKEECSLKEKPQCVNCVRSKRKDIHHGFREKQCPEYMRQVDLYQNRILRS